MARHVRSRGVVATDLRLPQVEGARGVVLPGGPPVRRSRCYGPGLIERTHETDVLVVGAGPTGLTAGIELRRGGVRCRVVDQLAEPMPYAKAVGVQPRTLEVFEGMGVVWAALDDRRRCGRPVSRHDSVVQIRHDGTDRPFAFLSLEECGHRAVAAGQPRRSGSAHPSNVGRSASGVDPLRRG
jgi:hypothetical protein